MRRRLPFETAVGVKTLGACLFREKHRETERNRERELDSIAACVTLTLQ